MAGGTDLSKAFADFVREGGDLLQGHALFEALHGKWLGSEPSRGLTGATGRPPSAKACSRPDDVEMAAFLAAEEARSAFINSCNGSPRARSLRRRRRRLAPA